MRAVVARRLRRQAAQVVAEHPQIGVLGQRNLYRAMKRLYTRGVR